MKKIFSAFLLMTMMVFSVGSFVACSDLENEIAAVDKQATTNAEAIADLNSKLSTLQTALTAAQADADAAMDAAKAAAADAKKAQEAGDAAAAAAAKAQAEAEAAKAAAAQAKADAIAEATKQVEAIQDEISKINYAITNLNGASEAQAVEIEALQGEIAKLQTAAAEHVYAITNLTGQVDAHEVSIEALQVQVKAMEATLVKYGENLEALGLLTEDIKTAIAQNVEAIQNLSGRVDGIEAEFGAELDAVKAAISQNVGSIQNLKGQLEALEAEVDGELNTIKKELEGVTATIEEQISEAVAEAVKGLAASIDALKNRLQSVSYVPEWTEGPKAVIFKENPKTGYVHMSFEVAPKAYAEKITAENTKLVGVTLLETKAVEPEEYAVKVLSADAETGIVEVLAYIPTDAAIWDAEKTAAVALRVNAADAQVTSAYVTTGVQKTDKKISEFVQLGHYDKDGKFVKGDITISLPEDTKVADSERELFKNYAVVVTVPGLVEAMEPAKVAELFTIELDIDTKESSYSVKNYKIENTYFVPADAEDEDDYIPYFTVNGGKEVTKALAVTAAFNQEAVDSLKANKSTLKGGAVVVKLNEGYFRVNGKALAQTLTATYVVGDLTPSEANIIVNENKPVEVEWSVANAGAEVEIEDIPVAGDGFVANVRDIIEEATSSTIKVYDPSDLKTALTGVTVEVVKASDDEIDVEVSGHEWDEDYVVVATYTVPGETAKDRATVYTMTFTLKFGEAPADREFASEATTTFNITAYTYEQYTAEDFELADTEVKVTGLAAAVAKQYTDLFKKVDADDRDDAVAAALAGATWTVAPFNMSTEVAGDAITAELEYAADVITITANETAYVALGKKNAYYQFTAKLVMEGINYVVTVVAQNKNAADWAVPTAPGAGLAVGKFNSQTLKGKNPFKWTWTNAYWTEDKDGDNAYDAEVDVKHNYNYVELAANATSYDFGGGELKLADYVQVVNVPAAELANYYITVEMTSAPKYKDGKDSQNRDIYKYYYHTGKNGANDSIPQLVYNSTNYALFASIDKAKVSADTVYVDGVKTALPEVAATVAGKDNTAKWYFPASTLDKAVIDWNNSRVNSISLTVNLVKCGSLMSKDSTTALNISDYIRRLPVVDSEPVVFSTPKAITVETVTGDAYEYKHGEQLVINLAKHIKVTDLFKVKDPQNNTVLINNPYARNWSEIWAKYAWTKVGTDPNYFATADSYGKYVTILSAGNAKYPDFFKVYDQKIKFTDLQKNGKVVEAGVQIKNSLGLELGAGKDYTFENGIITIVNTDLADFSSEFTFTVGIEVSHMHDSFAPEYKEIVVKVKNAQ